MIAYANYFTDARIKNYVDALLDAGASVDVFALGGEREAQGDDSLHVKTVGRKYTGGSSLMLLAAVILFTTKAAWHLLRRAFGGRYDVIHAHNMPNFLALVGLPFRLFGTKVILDVHDTMPEAYATKCEWELDSLPVRLLVLEQTVSAACADRVITTNRLQKNVLAGHGISSRNIDIIYNVGNRKIFRPRAAAMTKPELWLGYHGTVARRLGVLLIVDALRLLKPDCPEARLLCIGEGDELEEMKQRAADQGVAAMIEWQPFVAVERLPDALGRVQLGILGNLRDTERRHNYMLPVKMLEYTAMEIPTIAPRLKILTHYFHDSSAFFYEPDDPDDLANTIRRVYNDRRLITTRINGLRRFNVRYNWEQMARRYLTIIDDLTTR